MIMAKKQKQPAKTCADCIHESACRVWTDGRYISDAAATQCPNHETVKESGAYLCGVLDERKRKQTNADRIRAMSDEELAHFMAERSVNESTLLLLNENHGLTAVQIEALRHRIYCACMQWLKQPAEGDGNA
jgi:hypothetical protein